MNLTQGYAAYFNTLFNSTVACGPQDNASAMTPQSKGFVETLEGVGIAVDLNSNVNCSAPDPNSLDGDWLLTNCTQRGSRLRIDHVVSWDPYLLPL